MFGRSGPLCVHYYRESMFKNACLNSVQKQHDLSEAAYKVATLRCLISQTSIHPWNQCKTPVRKLWSVVNICPISCSDIAIWSLMITHSTLWLHRRELLSGVIHTWRCSCQCACGPPPEAALWWQAHLFRTLEGRVKK